MKTLMTRIGQNSKIFCLSDIEQIDNPYLSLLDNGGISCIKQEFKRSPLMANITLKQNERSPFSELVASVL
jgi:PhoH-like ATPase